MNNFYNKDITLRDVQIIEDYKPLDTPIHLQQLIIPDNKSSHRRYLGKLLYYGSRCIIEIYVKPNFSGVWIYGISYALEYLDTLNV